MKILSAFLVVLVAVWAKDCPNKKSNSKLICYYSKLTDIDNCYCSHVILPANSDVKSIQTVRDVARGVKIFVTVNEFNEGLVNLLKKNKVDGLEINLRKLDSKNDIVDFISTVKSKLGSDLDIYLSVPAKAEILAKYFDFKSLSKYADLFILQTAFLGASKNVTFHPSRLSGIWDMQNTDSVVDLVTGLGAPLSKLVIAAPVQAFQFTLQNADYTAPGSPALELKSITRNKLCDIMGSGRNWTMERDEDQAGPYIFSKDQWIAFEDSTSMDIKAKYSRIRGLAGMALKDVSQDGGSKCRDSILEAAYNGLSRQARAPRGAVLHSLEREMLETQSRPLDHVQVSPYRISRVIDTEGHWHVVRQDTRTEFQCSRQGYFVHPRSCNRFYRCVKFDQLSDEFSVFEFDCPAGLAFDERVEVCVWPGSLPHGTPCSGSSDIAPVPKQRFVCPSEPGYYADPENCRWFFACLDHGKSPLSAYEFRCPYGLVFDGDRLVCEWPWLVPKCGNGDGLGLALDSAFYYGGSAHLGNGANSGLILQQYDGLGVLGEVKLSGISGKIEQPVAKIYSNVHGSLGTLGYQNTDGYITGNGLGYKASQSLQQAGLLRINNGAALSQIYNANLEGASGNANIQYSSDNSYYGLKPSGLGVLSTTSQYENGANNGQDVIGLKNSEYHGSNGGAVSSQSFSQYHSNNGQNVKYQTNGGNLNIQYNAGALLGVDADAKLNSQYVADGTIENGLKTVQYQVNNGAANLNSLYTAGAAIHDLNADAKLNTQYVTGAAVDNGLKTVQYQVSNGALNSEYSAGSLNLNQGSQLNTQYLSGGVTKGSNIQHKANSADSGAFSSQSFTQHHGQGNQNTHYLVGPAVKSSGAGLETGNLNGAYNAGSVKVALLNGQYNAGSVNAALNNDARLNSQYVVDGTNLNGGAKTIQYQAGSYEDNANSGAVSSQSQSFTQYHDQGNQNTQYLVGSGVKSSGAVGLETGNLNGQYNVDTVNVDLLNGQYNAGSVNAALSNDAKLNSQYVVDGAYLNGGAKTVQYQTGSYENTGNSGAVSSQSFTQYHGKNQQENVYAVNSGKSNLDYAAHSGISGNINIVGGGYSAVGASYDGVQVTNHGENIESVTHVTPSPISVTTVASIPTVTSVPIPAIKTASAFEGYNGGVIANIPELQYKLQSQGNIGLQNISAGFVNYISTTASPLSINEGLQYEQPISSSQIVQYHGEQQKQHVQPVVNVNTNDGYVYNKPSIAFEETPIKTVSYLTHSTVRPAVTVVQPFGQKTLVSNTVKPLVTVFEQKSQPVNVDQGYVYEKPSIAFEEGPITVSTPKSFTVVNQVVEPVVNIHQPALSSYSFTKQHSTSDYNYEKQVDVSSYNIVKQPEVFVSSTAAPYVEQNVQIQPAVASYSFTQDFSKNQGYTYPKPSIQFEEKPIEIQKTIVQKVQPAVISKFSIQQPKLQTTLVQPTVKVKQYQQEVNTGGYYYEKPTIRFEDKPVQIVQPSIEVQKPVIGVSYQQQNVEINNGYQYPKPSIAFEENPKVNSVVNAYTYQQPLDKVVENYEYSRPVQQQDYSTSYYYQNPVVPKPAQPVVELYKQPEMLSTYTYQKPIQKTIVQQTPVTTYNYQTVAQQAVLKQGYSYPKPQIAFEEKPVVQTYSYSKPAVVSSYNYVAPSTTAKPQVIIQRQPEKQVGYTYPTPSVTFEEEPRQPAVGSFYSYTAPSTQRPTVLVKQPEQVLVQQQPAVVSSYNYVSPTVAQPQIEIQKEQEPAIVSTYSYQKPVEFKGYDYPKPVVPFVEEPQPFVTSYENNVPVEEVPFVKKKTYVTGQSNSYQYQQKTDTGYRYEKPLIKFEEAPLVVENYQSNYEKVRQEVLGSTVAPLDLYSKSKLVYKQPALVYQSTPRPTYTSTIQAVLAKNNKPVRIYSTAVPIVETVSTTSRPISRFSFSSLDDEYQHNQYNQNSNQISSTTVEPTRAYIPAKSRVRITTTEPSREYLPVKSRVRVTTTAVPVIRQQKIVEAFIAPEVTTLARDYLPVRTRQRISSKEYLPVEVTTPSNQYLPARSKVRVSTSSPAPEITTLTREYLPVRQRIRVTTTGIPLTEEEIQITPKRPAKVVKVVRPATVIKQSDYHPLLSAKLGAQCTCVSNTLKLRKKQKIIVVEDENDDDDDDGYLVAPENGEGSVVENYEYQPEKVVEITPYPEVYVKSTTNEVIPAPTPLYAVKKRVKVRPVTSTRAYYPVTDAAEVFLKKDVTPSVKIIKSSDDGPSDREIAKAVRTGLKLVKQAAKEGAREGTEEVISKTFDRYGPGGVRSKNEKLQGTIDCQRAGLFRHPTQCNKFYACRWDCTKNRFTLHVFNCPVHLTFDNSLGACNWPSQGPACIENTLLLTSD